MPAWNKGLMKFVQKGVCYGKDPRDAQTPLVPTKPSSIQQRQEPVRQCVPDLLHRVIQGPELWQIHQRGRGRQEDRGHPKKRRAPADYDLFGFDHAKIVPG